MPGIHRRKTPEIMANTTGRILAKPGPVTEQNRPGLHALGLDGNRDALLYVPEGYRRDMPAPFVLMLHGAGGSAENGLWPLRDLADEAGLILLAPSSRKQTWDVLRGGYGPDIDFINLALTQAFLRYNVDPNHLAIEGFSDGASYALSVGLMNGDLFTHIIAFSPGFMAPSSRYGSPRIFISHGVHDTVLPVNACSRRIVPNLKQAGYDVLYHEFDGGHTVPPGIALGAVNWFTAPETEK